MMLYLHGFRSSPRSYKAQLMAQTLQDLGRHDHWACPQLPASPAKAHALALEQAQTLANRLQRPLEELTIVGSSLGGFYAITLAETLGCRAVLLNPAVYAPRDLASQVGTHREYHSDEPFHFLPAYVDELQAMARATITHPKRYLLIAATGDEVLDWREMRDFFTGANQIIVQGSDHGLSDFTAHLPAVLDFAGLSQRPTTG